MRITQVLSRVGKFQVCSRADALSSGAGLVLIKEFMEQFQMAPLIDEHEQLRIKERGYNEGEAMLGSVYKQVVGEACLLDLKALRCNGGYPNHGRQLLRKFDRATCSTPTVFYRNGCGRGRWAKVVSVARVTSSPLIWTPVSMSRLRRTNRPPVKLTMGRLAISSVSFFG